MRLAAPPARWLVLTTLRARTGEHLRKVARHAVAKGAHLVLAYYEGQHPSGLVDPLARLAQRARFLRRRLGVCVDLVDGVLRSRRDLLALVDGADLVCLVDANEPPAARALMPDLLTVLLRAGSAPVWVVQDASETRFTTLHCCTSLSPADAVLLPWAQALAPARGIHLVHVLETTMPVPEPRESAQHVVFDHMLRQWRMRAYRSLEQWALPLRAAGWRPMLTVLLGNVEEVLAQHVRSAWHGVVLLGHRRRRCWPGERSSLVHRVAALGIDVLAVPLPRQPWPRRAGQALVRWLGLRAAQSRGAAWP